LAGPPENPSEELHSAQLSQSITSPFIQKKAPNGQNGDERCVPPVLIKDFSSSVATTTKKKKRCEVIISCCLLQLDLEK